MRALARSAAGVASVQGSDASRQPVARRVAAASCAAGWSGSTARAASRSSGAGSLATAERTAAGTPARSAGSRSPAASRSSERARVARAAEAGARPPAVGQRDGAGNRARPQAPVELRQVAQRIPGGAPAGALRADLPQHGRDGAQPLEGEPVQRLGVDGRVEHQARDAVGMGSGVGERRDGPVADAAQHEAVGPELGAQLLHVLDGRAGAHERAAGAEPGGAVRDALARRGERHAARQHAGDARAVERRLAGASGVEQHEVEAARGVADEPRGRVAAPRHEARLARAVGEEDEDAAARPAGGQAVDAQVERAGDGARAVERHRQRAAGDARALGAGREVHRGVRRRRPEHGREGAGEGRGQARRPPVHRRRIDRGLTGVRG